MPKDTVETPAERRKRLIYRSKYRGNKEMDILLGAFADTHLPTFTEAELDLYAVLLEQADLDLYGWIVGRVDVPAEFASPVMDLLQDFKVYAQDLSS